MNAEGKVEQRRIEFCLTEEEFDLLQSALGGYVIYTRSKNPREANRVQSLADKVIAAHAPSVAPPPRGEKRPIARPCSACGDGDTEMKYHDHYPPFADGAPSFAEAPAPTKERVSLSEAVYRTGGLSGPSQHTLGVRLGHIKPEPLIEPKMTTDEDESAPAPTNIRSEWRREELWWQIADEWVSDSSLRQWCYANMQDSPFRNVDVIRSAHVKAYAAAHTESAPALSESEEALRALMNVIKTWIKTESGPTKTKFSHPALSLTVTIKGWKKIILERAFKAGALGDTKEK